MKDKIANNISRGTHFPLQKNSSLIVFITFITVESI